MNRGDYNMYLSVKELADFLDKTERQILYMVNQGVANPINSDTYRSDGGFRFTQEEADRLKSMYKNDKLTLSEAAEFIGITPQYLNQLAIEKKISSQLIKIGKLHKRLFEPKDCIELKEELDEKKGTRRTKYGIKLATYVNGVRLFEVIRHNGQKARVVRTSPVHLLMENGEILVVKEPQHQSAKWPQKFYVRKKGFVDFKIPIPRSLEHQTYDTLYKMIEELGEKNIQIYETKSGDYYVKCRQGDFSGDADDFELLNMNLKTGKVHYEDKIIYLKTNYISKTINIPDHLFSKLKVSAKGEGISLEEKIIRTLEENL